MPRHDADTPRLPILKYELNGIRHAERCHFRRHAIRRQVTISPLAPRRHATPRQRHVTLKCYAGIRVTLVAAAATPGATTR